MINGTKVPLKPSTQVHSLSVKQKREKLAKTNKAKKVDSDKYTESNTTTVTPGTVVKNKHLWAMEVDNRNLGCARGVDNHQSYKRKMPQKVQGQLPRVTK